MKTISIINLKGGVAKTLTADSMAHVLATLHNKRVLLVDNDKQGNTSKAFGVHSYDDKSISDVLTARRLDPREVIKKTRFENIDVMPANMTLIRANMEVLMDSTRPQQTRLRSALNAIAEENFYDFCIIDNAPDINISTINALVASDDVIIPIKIDKYAFDGLEELKEQGKDTTLGSFTKFPDLILMDGGKGQVNIALEVLDELKLAIPVCGMVKDDHHRTRGLYFNNEEIPIDRHSEGFRLLTRIQDEAHRFAIEYHRSLRSKQQVRSILDDIPNIGETRRKALMRQFQSLEKIREASVEQLREVDGMNGR